MKGQVRDRHARRRCVWAGNDPVMLSYHDEEWGMPERDPRALWEMLMLEGFQAGLAWIIVLRKRETFREAFAGFDPEIVARFTSRDIRRLMNNAGIIRALHGHLEGPEAPWVQVRRPYHRVRLDAGRRHRQRPFDRLLPAESGRESLVSRGDRGVSRADCSQ